MNMNNRRKPANQGYGHKRPRHHHTNNGNGNNNNRPRRNYGAMREKYLTQARDAMASGDRVLAEYYLQHADHCYRMMMEEGERMQQHRRSQPQGTEEAAAENDGNEAPQETIEEVEIPENTSQLPAFLTANYAAGKSAAEPVEAQNWEERDNG